MKTKTKKIKKAIRKKFSNNNIKKLNKLINYSQQYNFTVSFVYHIKIFCESKFNFESYSKFYKKFYL